MTEAVALAEGDITEQGEHIGSVDTADHVRVQLVPLQYLLFGMFRRIQHQSRDCFLFDGVRVSVGGKMEDGRVDCVCVYAQTFESALRSFFESPRDVYHVSRDVVLCHKLLRFSANVTVTVCSLSVI